MHINQQPLMKSGDGPIVLVLAPTRELAQQIQMVASKYGRNSKIKNCCVFGTALSHRYIGLYRGGLEGVPLHWPFRNGARVRGPRTAHPRLLSGFCSSTQASHLIYADVRNSDMTSMTSQAARRRMHRNESCKTGSHLRSSSRRREG